MILAQFKCRGGDAFGKRDIRQVNDLPKFDLKHIDFEILGQIFGQTLNSISVACFWIMPPPSLTPAHCLR
jgi:hypothetical protein